VYFKNLGHDHNEFVEMLERYLGIYTEVNSGAADILVDIASADDYVIAKIKWDDDWPRNQNKVRAWVMLNNIINRQQSAMEIEEEKEAKEEKEEKEEKEAKEEKEEKEEKEAKEGEEDFLGYVEFPFQTLAHFAQMKGANLTVEDIRAAGYQNFTTEGDDDPRRNAYWLA